MLTLATVVTGVIAVLGFFGVYDVRWHSAIASGFVAVWALILFVLLVLIGAGMVL